MTQTPSIACLAALSALLVFGANSSAEARLRHHHRRMPPGPPASAAPGQGPQARAPSSFYPFEIEGGVSGNLPFNNQIRKMKDPLNANGAGK